MTAESKTPLWDEMNGRARHRVGTLSEGSISPSAGVYALYKSGEPVYVGKAASLRARLWRSHLRLAYKAPAPLPNEDEGPPVADGRAY